MKRSAMPVNEQGLPYITETFLFGRSLWRCVKVQTLGVPIQNSTNDWIYECVMNVLHLGVAPVQILFVKVTNWKVMIFINARYQVI